MLHEKDLVDAIALNLDNLSGYVGAALHNRRELRELRELRLESRRGDVGGLPGLRKGSAALPLDSSPNSSAGSSARMCMETLVASPSTSRC